MGLIFHFLRIPVLTQSNDCDKLKVQINHIHSVSLFLFPLELRISCFSLTSLHHFARRFAKCRFAHGSRVGNGLKVISICLMKLFIHINSFDEWSMAQCAIAGGTGTDNECHVTQSFHGACAMHGWCAKNVLHNIIAASSAVCLLCTRYAMLCLRDIWLISNTSEVLSLLRYMRYVLCNVSAKKEQQRGESLSRESPSVRYNVIDDKHCVCCLVLVGI